METQFYCVYKAGSLRRRRGSWQRKLTDEVEKINWKLSKKTKTFPSSPLANKAFPYKGKVGFAQQNSDEVGLKEFQQNFFSKIPFPRPLAPGTI